jgi:hypothetical protein
VTHLRACFHTVLGAGRVQTLRARVRVRAVSRVLGPTWQSMGYGTLADRVLQLERAARFARTLTRYMADTASFPRISRQRKCSGVVMRVLVGCRSSSGVRIRRVFGSSMIGVVSSGSASSATFTIRVSAGELAAARGDADIADPAWLQRSAERGTRNP